MSNDIARMISLLKTATNLEQKASLCIGTAMTVILCPDYVMRAILIDKLKKLFDVSDLKSQTKEFAKSFLKSDVEQLIDHIVSLDLKDAEKSKFLKDIRGICGINSN